MGYDRDMCFGGRSSTFWPIIIGVFIILVGVTSLLGDTFRWLNWDRLWPIFVIGIGVLIIANYFWKR